MVRELVVDTSVLVKWFSDAEEVLHAEARALEDGYTAGVLAITVPPLAFLELLNVAARRWRWGADRLDRMAERLDRTGFRVQQPDLRNAARWVSQGLSAYDASYVALAEERRTVVVSADHRLLSVAGLLAEPLAGFRF
ncbi:MAG: type II toxin-antitoxin system VapC family toxin [Chloroflexi bacterium]|nr:type II toxin-antitoxin system VapC family toxin [Chloroflexota bacterium]